MLLIQGYTAGELSVFIAVYSGWGREPGGNTSSDVSRVIFNMYCYMETKKIFHTDALHKVCLKNVPFFLLNIGKDEQHNC